MTPMFLRLDSGALGQHVQAAQQRVLYVGPGLTQAVAAALVNARKRLHKAAVRAVLDVSDQTARLGYGQFDGVTLLQENDVDVRTEPGLRTSFLVCDERGWVFTMPPLLVEDAEAPAGPNAMAVVGAQAEALLQATAPGLGVPSSGSDALAPKLDAVAPIPQLGRTVLTAALVAQVSQSLAANPPQKFDISRKVLVFNAYIEFVELRLTGTHIQRHTAQLPQDLILALKDELTTRRLRTSFNLVDGNSKVGAEAEAIDRQVRSLRERLTRSITDYGSVILREKRAEFEREVVTIRTAIARFRASVIDKLQKEIDNSRTKLVQGLLPALRKNPPQALRDQVSGRVTTELLKRYLDDRLNSVFPSAASLVDEMKLDFVPKGVTHETLSDPDFQGRVRAAFPYVPWDKPFAEFQAARQTTDAAPGQLPLDLPE